MELRSGAFARQSMTAGLTKWRFAVDRGGTFTDVLAIDPAGRLHSTKLLSESTEYDDAVIEGMRRVLGVAPGRALPVEEIHSLRMGTTVATNALLERRGEPLALLITRGFADLLEIGHQTRPDLFSLAIEKPAPLYAAVREVDERIAADGSVLEALDETSLETNLRELREDGFDAVAIVFLHAWQNPVHERYAAAAARRAGFGQVSVSHEVMPLIQAVGRGQTTLVDAYLSPVLRGYVESVRGQVRDLRLFFMQNAGGLADATSFSGKDAILSGPAGGVVACAKVAAEIGFAEVIGFDMGGTSTDVCRFDGCFDRVFETVTAGIPFQTPMLNVVTVAAGGGSLLRFDGRKLSVGPDSAGASPGPVCYGLGGPPALTDANAVLGRLLAGYFPVTFGPHHDLPLQVDTARERFGELTASINRRLGVEMSLEEVALGFVRIAGEMMCRPIKELTVARGRDARRHALICFGGAGGQHACSIARTLGIENIVVPRHGSLLSAYGIAVADHVRTGAEACLELFEPSLEQQIEKRFDRLAAPLIAELVEAGFQREEIRTRRSVDLRPQGTDATLNVEYDHVPQTAECFRRQYEELFGFTLDDVAIEAAALRVEVVGPGGLSWTRSVSESLETAGTPREFVPVWFEQGELNTPVYEREYLPTGFSVDGPAIVVEDTTTVLVEPGFRLRVAASGHLLLTATDAATKTAGTERDPVLLEVFNHLFMSVAEQMGRTLAHTAHSTNIRERHDFSCAVFDAEGYLVANAPHVPVHLGAMGDSVRSLIAKRGAEMRPGDAFVTNNPFQGGSHLPDVTVVTPVFLDNARPVFFVANRGHHADIGGIAPGSLAPEARTLAEEGVVLDRLLLVRDGRLLEDEIVAALGAGPYPARNLPERLSDLRAQVAANQHGRRELERLTADYGLDTVTAYMGHIKDNAAEAMAEALLRFVPDAKPFDRTFVDFLDDGARIQVRFLIEPATQTPLGVRALIDFSGSDPQLPGNLNAPLPVVRAAVLYVLRTLIHQDIPLNDGCLRPIELVVPEGSLLHPRPGAAVAGGNVETSQRIVDALYGALGVAAASQGTMNNFLFGRPDGGGRQYYETIAGGAGAVDGRAGASAVQVHMTNTRITDPEVLEYRYPEIRVERFTIRRGSGGAGRYRGGDGVIRAFRFLEPRRITILSERRSRAPYGLQGGKSGQPGVNRLRDEHGERVLPGHVTITVTAGAVVEIETPGGGGFGRPENTR
ncbi:MAG: hydantoinase B/oxoprolinase family protein [Candidatus Lernaella stagnicola]|nr:hydantoinase B/oxoprolinase family protein [Candidatus Lernaella stagnicola]